MRAEMTAQRKMATSISAMVSAISHQAHIAYILAIPGDAPTIRAEDVEDHAHRGGFTRAIWSEETKERTFSNFHRQIRDDVHLRK
jgi:molybdopterin-guanine dinucleotide biosynthesis protein A